MNPDWSPTWADKPQDILSGDSKSRVLPNDLPKSLDDRQPVHTYAAETEMYDAWQGQSHVITGPVTVQPLAFNLNLDDNQDDERLAEKLHDNDSRLMEMLAVKAANEGNRTIQADEEAIVKDDSLTNVKKRAILQKSLHNAASNGDIEQLRRLLDGPSFEYLDIDGPDEEGTAPIIYASCFGHQDVVTALLAAGAEVDRQDKNQWTSLMWAMTNRHKEISKILLDHGASPDIQSSSGRTAFDFVAPNSDMSEFLQENGYQGGDGGMGDDFYDSGIAQDKFEQEMEESEMKRRMMMESAINLEVDLSSLGMDEHVESPDDLDDAQEFLWDRCLNDQMFVVQENELDRILDIVITSMTPQRSPSQKPVPANVLFLAARYAHYHGNPDLLAKLLLSAMDAINQKVEKHQWDMTVLAFWMSNATLLLHYLKKDTGLVGSTTSFQLHLVELINEIFVLIIRDAERRIDKVLKGGILDHETIPFDHLEFVGEWNIFKSKNKVQPEALSYRPPSPSKRAQLAPRNITSILSSTLFVLKLYDIHSYIIAQILAQLFYWLGAEIFNHIVSNKIYLARTKAMQIRMNISTLEDWARSNNQIPEHYENGSLTASGENTIESARKHLTPVIQLLQWLQCFSSLDYTTEASDSLGNTLKQLTRLTPRQIYHSVSNYRYEKEEKTLPKGARKRLIQLQNDAQREWDIRRLDRANQASNRHQAIASTTSSTSTDPNSTASHTPGPQISGHGLSSPQPFSGVEVPVPVASPVDAAAVLAENDEEPPLQRLTMNPSHMLQFSLPTTVDMRLSYGAGYGGVNRERERLYTPTLPPEFLAKLDNSSTGGGDVAVDRNGTFDDNDEDPSADA